VGFFVIVVIVFVLFLSVMLFLFSSISENSSYLNKDLETPYQSVIHTSVSFFFSGDCKSIATPSEEVVPLCTQCR